MAKKKEVKNDDLSLDDLLNEVSEKVVEKKAEVVSKYRPEIEGVEELMSEYTAIDAISKIAESKQKILAGELKSEVWHKFTDLWFETQAQPTNPKIETKKGIKVDCQAIYQCRNTFKVQSREGFSGKMAVIEPLKEVGFSEKTATKIFDDNIDIVVETGLKSYTELAKGKYTKGGEFVPSTDVEKSAVKKLLLYTRWDGESKVEPLTAEERAASSYKETSYQVKAGFLGRAVSYCSNADELRGLLTIIKPQEALSSVKFAVNDTESEKQKRLLTAFNDLLFGGNGNAEQEVV